MAHAISQAANTVFGLSKLVSTIYLIINGNVFESAHTHTDAHARMLAKNDRIVKLNGEDKLIEAAERHTANGLLVFWLIRTLATPCHAIIHIIRYLYTHRY